EYAQARLDRHTCGRRVWVLLAEPVRPGEVNGNAGRIGESQRARKPAAAVAHLEEHAELALCAELEVKGRYIRDLRARLVGIRQPSGLNSDIIAVRGRVEEPCAPIHGVAVAEMHEIEHACGADWAVNDSRRSQHAAAGERVQSAVDVQCSIGNG